MNVRTGFSMNDVNWIEVRQIVEGWAVLVHLCMLSVAICKADEAIARWRNQ